MPISRSRYPLLDPAGSSLIVDPKEVNRKFRSLARLVNGRLGVENLERSRFLPAAALVNPRSLAPMFFGIYATDPAGAAPWANDSPLCTLQADATLVAVSVWGASTNPVFTGQIRVGGVTRATVIAPSTPAEGSYICRDITTPAFTSGEVVKMTIPTAGSYLWGLCLWWTFAHQSGT